MGHLGDSTLITTVQDKEIVLTGSDGQTFKMKVADLAEAIRQVMPVATNDINGLMSNSDKKHQTRIVVRKGYHRIAMLPFHYCHAVFLITSTKNASSIPSTRIISIKGNDIIRSNTLFIGTDDCKIFHRMVGKETECWIFIATDSESFAYISPLCSFGATFNEVFSDTLPNNSTEVLL